MAGSPRVSCQVSAVSLLTAARVGGPVHCHAGSGGDTPNAAVATWMTRTVESVLVVTTVPLSTGLMQVRTG